MHGGPSVQSVQSCSGRDAGCAPTTAEASPPKSATWKSPSARRIALDRRSSGCTKPTPTASRLVAAK
eukprot:scaffold321656_cov31-Tisochrysis_lutea.AAC.5